MNDIIPRQAPKVHKAFTPLLEIRNLSKTFDGQLAVDDVNLTIYKGEILRCSAHQAVENPPYYACWLVSKCPPAGRLSSMGRI